MLMRENLIAFILFETHDSSRTRVFIMELRFRDSIIIHHQAALAPNLSEGILPPARSDFMKISGRCRAIVQQEDVSGKTLSMQAYTCRKGADIQVDNITPAMVSAFINA